MGKRIVVLSGSPRKGATTDRLTAAFIEGAKAVGHEVSCFRVADMKIEGCRGCGNCISERGVCVIKDDMQQILESLKQAEGIVLASPVYYFSITAQLKLAVDRLYSQLRVGMPIKRAALLMTCGGASEAAASSVSMFRQISSRLNWEEAGIIITSHLHKPDEIDGREELDSAKQLGQKFF
jgi:multimeric flavodoxin WrbA